MNNIKNIAKKLGLTDEGIYPNHKCGCGVDAHLGKDADDIIWSWCPNCKTKLNVVSYPRFPCGSLVK